MKTIWGSLWVGLMLAAVLLANPSNAEPLHKRGYFNFGSKQVNGGKLPTRFWQGKTNKEIVNLGGWGVLEPWITPSIFQNVSQSLGIVDEFTLCEKLPIAEATSILQSHWSTWYTYVTDLISHLTLAQISGFSSHCIYGDQYSANSSW